MEKIHSYEPNVQIRIASKSIFSLNIQSNNKNIPDIFKFIEESKSEYGIEDYTVASTSLEDVFLKINNQSNLNEMKYINKKAGSKEILVAENLIEINDFLTQFLSQLERNLLPLYRNKIILLLEYLSGLVIIYIFAFMYKFVNKSSNIILDLIEILEENKIYIYEEDNSINGILKDSYAYNSLTMTLKALSKKPNNVQNLIDLAYDESFAHIAMGCISINQIGDEWDTYITNLNLGNLFADTMFLVSAYLKKEFGINAIIINKIKMKKDDNIVIGNLEEKKN